MPSFSKTSIDRLATCHPDLQRLFNEVVKTYDCTILCGHRGEVEQNEAVKTGASKLPWPKSKHNSVPSMAVDVAPCVGGIEWKDYAAFYHLAGFVRATALRLGIKIRFGGDWDGNYNLRDENFRDLPHFELVS